MGLQWDGEITPQVRQKTEQPFDQEKSAESIVDGTATLESNQQPPELSLREEIRQTRIRLSIGRRAIGKSKPKGGNSATRWL